MFTSFTCQSTVCICRTADLKYYLLMPHLIWFDCSYFTHHQFEKISQDVLFISPDVTQFLKLAEGSNNLTTIYNSNDDKFRANDNSYM